MNRIKEINWLYLITILIYLCASSIINLLKLPDGIPALLASQILLAAPAIIYLFTTKQSLKETIRLKKIPFLSVFFLLIFSYLIMPFLTLLNAISMLFSTNIINGTITNIVDKTPFIFSITAIAFIPCILEESVYRGVFYNVYRKVDIRKGIILSGLLFALLHMNFNQFVYAFAMGVIFALLIEATDSILSSMVVHFVINGNSVVLTYLLPKFQKMAQQLYGDKMSEEMLSAQVAYSTQQILLTILVYGFIALFTTTLAVLLYIAIAKYCNRWNAVKEIFHIKQFTQHPKTKFLTIPLIIGIVICIFNMVMLEVIQ